MKGYEKHGPTRTDTDHGAVLKRMAEPLSMPGYVLEDDERDACSAGEAALRKLDALEADLAAWSETTEGTDVLLEILFEKHGLCKGQL